MNRFHSTEYRCCLTGFVNPLVAAKEQKMKDQTRTKKRCGNFWMELQSLEKCILSPKNAAI